MSEPNLLPQMIFRNITRNWPDQRSVLQMIIAYHYIPFSIETIADPGAKDHDLKMLPFIGRPEMKIELYRPILVELVVIYTP